MSMLEMALEHARNGFPVFPLWPMGKAPHSRLAPNGWHDATTEEARIRAWWHDCPDANIGIPVPDGRIALDCDPLHGAKLGDLLLPRTRTVRSRSGGFHLFFVHPGFDLHDRGLKEFVCSQTGREYDLAGWDLREGGRHYLVGPGSVVADPDTGEIGTYSLLIDEEPGVLPYAIRESMRSPEKPVREKKIVNVGKVEGKPSTFEDFNARTDWADILEPRGWTFVRSHGGREYWMRPGKTDSKSGFPHSASTGNGHDGEDLLWVWSTAGEGLPLEESMTKAFVWAHFNTGGDMSEAGRTLREAGYGYEGTEEEKGDPFSPYRDLETIAKKQGGLKGPGKTSVRAQASRAQVLAADAAVASVADGLGSDSSGVVITSEGQIAESELEDRWQARIAEQEARGYWLPDEFWESPECRALAHIRSSARAAGVSPEGVLLSSMAEVAVRIMPNVKIPDYVKTPASLSFGVLLVGGSGSDKSSSVDMSQEIFEWRGVGDWESHYFGLSSSQGIAGQYQHWHKDRNQPGYMRRDRWSAMADEDEGDKIAALCEKNGLDLVSAIRSALMGKLLGAGNVGETKTNLPKHSYRFVMRICTLPAHCAWVLSDDVGGLPQRLLWACVEDARVFVESPPGKFPIALPAEFLLDPISGALRPEFMLTADEEVRAEVVRDSELRKKLGVSKLDEHALLTKMKVAWILAAMHGRSHVRVDVEWRLAEMVMQMSNAARGFAQGEVQRAALERAQAEALRKGRGRVIEESVVRAHDETGDRKRAADAVIRMLGRNVEQGMTKGELRAKLKADIRHLLDEGVLDGLIEAGQIRYEDIVVSGQQVGSRWFLTCG